MRLIYLILVAISLFACSKKPAPQVPEPEVVGYRVTLKTLPANFTSVGVAASPHPVEIRARVEGYLKAIEYVEGSFVKENKILFQIDPAPFLAELEQAKAGLAREEAVLWRAKKSVARFTPLYEQKAASERDLDNAIASMLTAEASVIAAKAKVIEAELNLGYTTIRSPIDGLTSSANYREGALISQANPKPLTTVSVIDPIWVNFSLSENDLLEIQQMYLKGTIKFPENDDFEVYLTLADGSIYPQKGKVNFKAPTFDTNTGTMVVRAEFPNHFGLIKPGQFAQATVKGGLYPNALAVPQQAVQQGENGLFVFLIDSESRVIMRNVKAGNWQGDSWIIYSGINEGDVVIIEGVNKVQPCQKVKVKEVTQ